MKTTVAKLAMTTALTGAVMLPAAMASARPLTLSATLKNYRSSPAYLAIYVTDAKGAYQGTLWMAGGRPQFYRHLISWNRATRGNLAEISGITGASVGSGQTLNVKLDVVNALFDAGYVLHIDAAVEGWRESPSDVVVPLTTKGAGKPVHGRHFVRSFKYSF